MSPPTPSCCMPNLTLSSGIGWPTWLGPESASQFRDRGNLRDAPLPPCPELSTAKSDATVPHITSPWRKMAWQWPRGWFLGVWLPHWLLLGFHREESSQTGRPGADSTGRKECCSGEPRDTSRPALSPSQGCGKPSLATLFPCPAWHQHSPHTARLVPDKPRDHR